MDVTLQTTIEAPWTDLAPLRTGEPLGDTETPKAYALVEEDGIPVLRIDLYASPLECFAFQEAIVWGGFVVIGFGGHVYLAAQHSREVRAYPQEGYFGHVYPTGERLFIASAERLTCIGTEGEIVWRTEPLGLDGVVVDDIREGVLYGQGEWDPPGGWKPFQVDLTTGKCLRDQGS